MPSTYAILKTIHVLAAVAWAGGGLMFNLIAARMTKAGGPAAAAFGATSLWLGTRFFLPLSLIVPVIGIVTALVGGFDLWTPWLVVGMVAAAALILVITAFLLPESKRIAGLAMQRGLADPKVARRARRLTLVARVVTLVLFLVVINMVLKPGI